MTTTYKPCEPSPIKEHSFTGEDARCFWCDAKPWYVSIRADHPDGAPVDPTESFLSMVAYSAAVEVSAPPPAVSAPTPCSQFQPGWTTEFVEWCATCGEHRIDHAMDAGGIGHPPAEQDIVLRDGKPALRGNWTR